MNARNTQHAKLKKVIAEIEERGAKDIDALCDKLIAAGVRVIDGELAAERFTERDERAGSAYFPYCIDVCGQTDEGDCRRDCDYFSEICERLAQFEDAVEEASG